VQFTRHNIGPVNNSLLPANLKRLKDYYFVRVHIVHFDNYQSFLPSDAQLNSLKNNFKFSLKLTLKAPTCFGVKNTIIREYTV
jgi:hypothetical protein